MGDGQAERDGQTKDDGQVMGNGQTEDDGQTERDGQTEGDGRVMGNEQTEDDGQAKNDRQTKDGLQQGQECIRSDDPEPRSEEDMAVDRIAGLLRKAGKHEAAEELLLLARSDSTEIALEVSAEELQDDQIPLSVDDAEAVLAAQLRDGGGDVETGLALVVKAAHRTGQTWVELTWQPDTQEIPLPVIYEPYLNDLIRHREEQLESVGDVDAVLAMNILANAGDSLPAYMLGFYCSVRDHLPISFEEGGDAYRYLGYCGGDDSDVGDAVAQVLAPAHNVAEKLLSAMSPATDGALSDFDKELLDGAQYAEAVDLCIDLLHDHPVAVQMDGQEIETAISLIRSFMSAEGEEEEQTEKKVQMARGVLEECARKYQESRKH